MSTTHNLSGERTAIGRASDNDILVEEESVSLHHCEIYLSGGKFLVRDLGSSSGTMVNWEITTECLIKDGDIIHLGSVQCTFSNCSTDNSAFAQDQISASHDGQKDGHTFKRFAEIVSAEVRRRVRMIALEGEIKELRSQLLGDAYFALGKKAYEVNYESASFAAQYDEIVQLEKGISLMKEGVDASSGATASDYVKNGVAFVKNKLDVRDAEIKLKRQLELLGTQVALLPSTSVIADELNCITRVLDRIKKAERTHQVEASDRRQLNSLLEVSNSFSGAVANAHKRSRGIYGIGAAIFISVILIILVVSFITKKRDSLPVQGNTSPVQKVSQTNQNKVVWDKIQCIEAAGSKTLHDLPIGKYPTDQTGFYDFQHFDNGNFETLRDYYAKRAEVQYGVSRELGALPRNDVDKELVSYMNNLCNQWEAGGKYDYDFAKIVATGYEQRNHYTSTSAYALRFLSAYNGDGRMEAKYKESQEILDNMTKDWIAQRGVFQTLTDRIQVEEREVKTLLSRRYRTEFN